MESTIKSSYAIRLNGVVELDDDFETYDDAIKYAKDKYPNSPYKIVKITEEILVTVLPRRYGM